MVRRFLTLNLWGAEAPLEQRMAIVARGIAELAPDVIALQEVREVSGSVPNQAQALAQPFGYHHVFAPAVEWGGGVEGLAILSRAPIAEHAALELPHAQPQERRLLLSARIEGVSGGHWVHTTHLNYRLNHGKQREDQVRAVEAAVAARAGDAPQILMGDFNARPESDEIRWLTGLTTIDGGRVHYQDAWARRHPAESGWTWAAANPYTARLRFLEPDRRIDYIFVSSMRGDGRGDIRACRIVFDQPDADGAFASDHFGLLADVRMVAGGDS